MGDVGDVGDVGERAASAGVWLPYTGQAPEAFFLPLESLFSQTLTRLCYLLRGTVQLGFSIDHVDRRGVALRWTLGEQELALEHRFERSPDAVPRAMATLLAPLNTSLIELGHRKVILVVDPKTCWTRHGHNVRLLLADPRIAQALRASGALLWGEEHLDESGELGELELDATFARLPLPEEIVPEPEHFLPTGPYGQAFAVMTETLASRLSLDLQASPFPNRPSAVNFYGNEFTIPITVQHSYLQTTCRIDHPADDDGIIALLEELQMRVELENMDREESQPPAPIARKPYWLRVGPGSDQVVLATTSQAEELRTLGYLREGRHHKRLLEAVEGSGEALPAYRGVWRQLLPQMAHTLGRLTSCAPERSRCSLTTTQTGDTLRIVVRVGARSEALETDAKWVNHPIDGILAWICRGINGPLRREGSDHRVMILGGRLLWLTSPWIAQFIAMDHRLKRYLEAEVDPDDDDAARPLRFPVPVGLPEAHALEEFARTRLPVDIVGTKNLLDSDFKSSCREEDYPSVFDAIATFAGVSARCQGLARGSEDRYTYTLDVTRGDSASTVVLENRKYPDVSPIVEHLNPMLEADARSQRLYVYRTPDSEGVLLASEAQAEELAHLRYVSRALSS